MRKPSTSQRQALQPAANVSAVVAILGRPNVGKSTLFNRLVGRQEALVEDRPGVTRDRHYGVADWEGVRFTVVDTGGFTEQGSKAFEDGEGVALHDSVRRQAERALREGEVALLVVDAQVGITADDQALAELVRRSGKPVLVAANKVDSAKAETTEALASVYALGFASVFPISASHGRGVNDLLDQLLTRLPAPAPGPNAQAEAAAPTSAEADASAGVPRVAVVGRPNAGKSTLLNQLLGEERLVVSEVPGTTRDAIEVEVVRGQRRYRFLDTAGIRRKVGRGDGLEQESAALSEAALRKCDVAVILFDAQEPAVEQDARLTGEALRLGKPLILAANKVDLLAGAAGKKRLREAVAEHLKFVFANAPIVELSAARGSGLPALLATITRLYEQSSHRIGTPEMNRFLGEAEDAHPAPRHAGHPVRLYYMAQVSVRPPTFLIHVNRPEGITEAYRRFLENRMRDRWKFEIPLRLLFKRRRRS